ncbi:MAG: transglycosylase SLT domain-containing protein [Anaerolineales bacterium]|nr:transglycosylase SLT domain-containing protein [Anaerolineales bacterium]
MPRARTTKEYESTAATPHDEGSGCLSGFAIIPLAVIVISILLSSVAWNHVKPLPVSIQNNSVIDVTKTPDSISRNISPIFRPEVQYWADSIVKWASASSLDPNLVATIMQIESCGDPRAKSSAGAMGLFQVMPFHFHTSDSPYNPDTNALRGLGYLVRSLNTANGNARLAMAGYNGGISVISKSEHLWSAQTKRYVYFGSPIYQDAISGVESSSALNEWYTKYGVSLCRQAAKRLGLP